MNNQIQVKRCFLGFDCIEKQCPAWTTFTDTPQGVCAFRIGSTVVKMLPGMISEITGILKKLSLFVFLFLMFSQPVFSQDTWDNNKKYIGQKLDDLTTEVKGVRTDVKIYSENLAKEETLNATQGAQIKSLEDDLTGFENSLKYLYTLLFLSIGGNAVSGGVLLKNRKNGKPQTTNNEI